MSEAAFDELANAIKGAWAARSGVETGAQAETLAADALRAARVPDALLDRMRARAALSGAVKPRDLLARLEPGDTADAALDLVALSFDRILDSGEWWWTLRGRYRTKILTQARDAPDRAMLAAMLVDVLAIDTDPPGYELRRIVADGAVDPWAMAEDVPDAAAEVAAARAKLVALAQAVEWARPLLRADDVARVRRRLALLTEVVEHDRRAGKGLVGRNRELRRLVAFATRRHQGALVPLVAIEGIGGAGKSALVGRLTRDLLVGEDMAADTPILVGIDFARRTLLRGGELECSFEVTRQLGLAEPAAAAAFEALREEVRGVRSRRNASADTADALPEGLRLDAAWFEAAARAIVGAHRFDERRIVLVIDTIEAVGGTDDPLMRRTAEWVLALVDRMGLAGLRVIVSGRAPPAFDRAAFVIDEAVRLGDLPTGAAATMLIELGLARAAAWSVARRMRKPRTPPALKLVAERLASLSADDRRRWIKKSYDPADPAELARHLLEAIADPVIRTLAMASLPLRRLTAAAIGAIVGPVAGLPDVDAAAAMAGLEGERWLFLREGDALAFVADTRRVLARDAVATIAVHARAADWYGALAIADPAAAREAAYHRLMRNGAAGLDAVTEDNARDLAEWASDFSAPIANGLGWIASGRGDPATIAALPPGLREQARDHAGARLLARGDAAAALALWRAHPGVLTAWAIRAAVESGDWDGLRVDALTAWFATAALGDPWGHALTLAQLIGGQALLEAAAAAFTARLRATAPGGIEAADLGGLETIAAFDRLNNAIAAEASAPFLRAAARLVATTPALTPRAWQGAVAAFSTVNPDVVENCPERPDAALLALLRPEATTLRALGRAARGADADTVAEVLDAAAAIDVGAHDAAWLTRAWPAQVAARVVAALPPLGRNAWIGAMLAASARGGCVDLRPAARRALGVAMAQDGAVKAITALGPLPADFAPDRLASDIARRPLDTALRLVAWSEGTGRLDALLAAMTLLSADPIVRRMADAAAATCPADPPEETPK